LPIPSTPQLARVYQHASPGVGSASLAFLRYPLAMVQARWCVLLLVLMTMPTGSLARAQNFGRDPRQDVRLDWTVAQGREEPEIAGCVYNLRDGYWAANVQLQVEALDASGNIIGSRWGSVFGLVPPSGRSYFEIPVPIVGAASYRVTVRTLDWRSFGAGGGAGM
jgi:hypothetical protein